VFQAIVFLPLLGAIIAGLIALTGSYRRATTEPDFGHDSIDLDAVDAGAMDSHGHTHQEPDGGLAAHVHSHPTSHGHSDHMADDSTKAAEWITTGLIIVSALLSWVAFIPFVAGGAEAQRIELGTWFNSGTLAVDWSIYVDTLTAVMLVVVTTVSSLVHLYSIGYMHEDPHRARFFSYLSLFTFAMLMLVTADNLVQLFFGWEGVGLCSYLLIGFWYHRPAANAAAIKAFIVNRVGDFGFALGIFGVFFLFGTVGFETIFANVGLVAEEHVSFLGREVPALELIGVLLFIGAMGKSAQIFLHTWLPDAMEGPTPVSALIHAATMVTAGVFLVARMAPLYEHAHAALNFMLFIGATTAFFAGTVGLVQNDIKRIIAYSTCSQLGYMFVALGTGAYSAGIFHLFTHAAFKALLFLGAGSVIHALAGEQDIRKMGGLRSKLPYTYAVMLIGTLALTGFPLTAGYFSKDAIIEAAFMSHSPAAFYAFLATLTTAGLTAFYSWRLVLLTFHGETRAPHHLFDHAHESPPTMSVPLGILAFGSLAAGLIFAGPFIGDAFHAFWGEAIPDNGMLEEIHHAPAWVKAAPFVAMATGLGVAIWFYVFAPHIPRALAATNDLLYRFLLNKWYFDQLYDLIFVRPAMWLGRVFWKQGDGMLIDGLGPDGVSARVLDATRDVVRLQSGYLYHYAFAMLIGLALAISWMLFS
jgi:NADH-quinone oxidoreductase subunit L